MSFIHSYTPEQDGPHGRACGPDSVGHAHDSREALVWEGPRQIGLGPAFIDQPFVTANEEASAGLQRVDEDEAVPVHPALIPPALVAVVTLRRVPHRLPHWEFSHPFTKRPAQSATQTIPAKYKQIVAARLQRVVEDETNPGNDSSLCLQPATKRPFD